MLLEGNGIALGRRGVVLVSLSIVVLLFLFWTLGETGSDDGVGGGDRQSGDDPKGGDTGTHAAKDAEPDSDDPREEQRDEPSPLEEAWAAKLSSEEAAERHRAIDELLAGGSKYVPVLGALLAHDDRDVRETAGDTLARIGDASVEELIRRANSDDAVCRYHAVSTIGDLAPDAIAALDVLIDRLGDVDLGVAAEATWAVAAFRERAAPATQALVTQLDHFDPLVRIYAAGALASIGPSASSSVAALVVALNDRDAGVRRCAADALASFGEKAFGAVAALGDALEDGNIHVRVCAIGALGSIGPKAKAAEKSLRDCLDDASLAHDAAWALTRITGEKVEVSGLATAGSAEVSITNRPQDPNEWTMLGRTPSRNAVAPATNFPTEWDLDSGKNVRWSKTIGVTTYAGPIVAKGMVFVGTDNEVPSVPEYEKECGVLKAYRASDGEFLWQDVSPDLGRGFKDFLMPVVSSSPYIEGDRLYYIASQAQVRSLDIDGFRDGENEGPIQDEEFQSETSADHIWELDLGAELGVFPHEAPNCSMVAVGDLLMICTANGVDEAHVNVPAPRAPSFIGVRKSDGKVLWRVVGPGKNILHGQWSSPAVAEVNGRVQAFFGGGDGWLYGLEAATGREIWRYDGNPKNAVWRPSGDTPGIVFRNSIIACPVFHEGRVILAMGQDPEHGEGKGLLHSIDVGGSGDVTSSRVAWKYEEIGRTIATPVISDGLLYVADYNGYVHCVDASNGEQLWTHDLFAGVWGGLLVAGDKVYVGDEDGGVTIFAKGRTKKLIAQHSMDSAVYCAPIAIGDVLYVATSEKLYAIGPTGEGTP